MGVIPRVGKTKVKALGVIQQVAFQYHYYRRKQRNSKTVEEKTGTGTGTGAGKVRVNQKYINGLFYSPDDSKSPGEYFYNKSLLSFAVSFS